MKQNSNNSLDELSMIANPSENGEINTDNNMPEHNPDSNKELRKKDEIIKYQTEEMMDLQKTIMEQIDYIQKLEEEKKKQQQEKEDLKEVFEQHIINLKQQFNQYFKAQEKKLLEKDKKLLEKDKKLMDQEKKLMDQEKEIKLLKSKIEETKNK